MMLPNDCNCLWLQVVHNVMNQASMHRLHRNAAAPGGRLPYETDGDARRLAQRCKFWIFFSLTVFREKRQYLKPRRSRLGFREETLTEKLHEEKQKSNFPFNLF